MLMTPLKAPPKIAGPGATYALNTSWTTCAIPALPNGNKPRFVMLTVDAYQYANVRYYEGTEFNYTRGIGLCPDLYPYVFDVQGCANIFAYKEEASAVNLHVTPLANQ